MLLQVHSGVIMCKTATATVTDRKSGRLLTDERGTFRHHHAAECCPLPESCIVNLQAYLSHENQLYCTLLTSKTET